MPECQVYGRFIGTVHNYRIDLFLIGKPFVKITLQISISKTGYGTFIADQFMHRHQLQATDGIDRTPDARINNQTEIVNGERILYFQSVPTRSLFSLVCYG